MKAKQLLPPSDIRQMAREEGGRVDERGGKKTTNFDRTGFKTTFDMKSLKVAGRCDPGLQQPNAFGNTDLISCQRLAAALPKQDGARLRSMSNQKDFLFFLKPLSPSRCTCWSDQRSSHSSGSSSNRKQLFQTLEMVQDATKMLPLEI